MTKAARNSASTTSGLSLAEAMHLQAMEGNPLDAEEIAMFEMFEREGWSPERRRDYILREIKLKMSASAAPAAE